MTTQTHFRLNNAAICQNRRQFKTTTERAEVTCKRCLDKLAKMYERLLRPIAGDPPTGCPSS